MNPSVAAATAPAAQPGADLSLQDAAPVSAQESQDTRLALALARLQASRAQLRAAMLPPPQEQPASSGFELPRRWRARWRAWTRSGPLALLTGTAMDAVGNWWRSQPWHASTEWAGRAVLAEATPLIRRHPFWAMALGIGAGAALVAARPWRWQAVNRRVRPIGGHLVSWVVAQLSQVPVQMALAALLAQFVGERVRGQTDAAPKATATPAPHPAPDPAPDGEPVPARPDPAAPHASVH